MKHQSKFTSKPKEVKEIVIDPEFEAVISGPYEEEVQLNPTVKQVGLRLTTPTCPPLPEELESRVHESLLAQAPGEVVASFAVYPHKFDFVTYPSGKKLTIPR